MEEKSKLKEFKEKYEILRKKFDLPEFDQLNRDFSIEKAAENETDYIVREIRRIVTDRIFNYLRFIETLINPSNAPMSIFSLVKTLGKEEKDKLNDIYQKLMKHEIQYLKLELDFSEENEAKILNESNELWQEVKRDFLSVLEVSEKYEESKKSGSNGRGYFG